MRRKTFVRRGRRPAGVVTWASLASQWVLASVTASTAVRLLGLEMPTNLSNITSDPPEDLTVLRIRGSFLVQVGASSHWTLGLIVQDHTWTPGTTFADDADKRILWSRSFNTNITAATTTWSEPGQWTSGGSQLVLNPMVTEVDIAPKVRIEPGKALYLVAWENSGNTTLSSESKEMRCLFKRSGRR